jgi:lipopolysaccharide export system protein LptC
LSASIVIPERGEITIQSPEGVIDADKGLAILQGGAVLESSTGYRVATESIVTSYINAEAVADSEVRATGPAGLVTAGALELRKHTDGPEGYVLVFKEGVRLVYEPKP